MYHKKLVNITILCMIFQVFSVGTSVVQPDIEMFQLLSLPVVAQR
jgi:hypothetical protein